MALRVELPDEETAQLVERLAKQTNRSVAAVVSDAIRLEEMRLERACCIEARRADLKLAL